MLTGIDTFIVENEADEARLREILRQCNATGYTVIRQDNQKREKPK